MQTIFCTKLQQELPALTAAPFPGPLGERILKNISKSAWQQWVKQQTMLINDNRLILTDPKAREFVSKKMLEFLFDESNKN